MRLTPTHPAVTVYGTQTPGEGLVRMPDAAACAVSANVRIFARDTSGIRLCFATDSRRIGVKLRYGRIARFHRMPLSGIAGVDLYEHLAPPAADALPDWAVDYRTPSGIVARKCHSFEVPLDLYDTPCAQGTWHPPEPGLRQYTLFLPLYAAVTDLELCLDDDAVVRPHGIPYINDRPVVFYGSSIVQGGGANRPSTNYPARISRMHHLDYLNMGFSGSALGEPAMADYLATLDMEALVYDYDFNAPSLACLRDTHQPFFQKLRALRPDLPILILTAAAPATSRAQHAEYTARRALIHSTYQAALNAGDTRVAFRDMTACFYGPGCQSTTVDDIHPTDEGYARMAEWIAAPLMELLNR